jgi:CRP-like cAMP-binding protein
VSPRFVPATVHELTRVALLAELPGEQLTKLAGRMQREEVGAGHGIMSEGDQGDRFYVLLSGLLGVTTAAMGAKRILRAGDYFGEVALAMDVPRTATVRALTNATVASCDRETFDEFVRPLLSADQ